MAVPTYPSSSTASRPTAATLTCAAVATEAERCSHFRIRHQVFVIEQGMFGGSYGGPGGDDTDAHDVLVLQAVGDVEHKVRGAYHRNLRRLIVPRGNVRDLEASGLVPRAVLDELVAPARSLEEAAGLAFDEDPFAAI